MPFFEFDDAIVNPFEDIDDGDRGEWQHPFMIRGSYLDDGVYQYACKKCNGKVPLADIICEFKFCPYCGYSGKGKKKRKKKG